jgi:hypothetical protein
VAAHKEHFEGRSRQVGAAAWRPKPYMPYRRPDVPHGPKGGIRLDTGGMNAGDQAER